MASARHPASRPAPCRRTWRLGASIGIAVTAMSLLWPSLGATAEPMADPTRPPAAWSPALLRPAGPAASQPAASRVAAVMPALQAVLRPAQGTPTALIDGRVLKVGETLGEWTLVAIQPDAVQLRGSSRTVRLPLLAGLNSPQARPTPTHDAASTPTSPANHSAAEPLSAAMPKEP